MQDVKPTFIPTWLLNFATHSSAVFSKIFGVSKDGILKHENNFLDCCNSFPIAKRQKGSLSQFSHKLDRAFYGSCERVLFLLPFPFVLNKQKTFPTFKQATTNV